ncbi:hypothetical protein [Sphingomonas sp.]|uniref:hypothetical protein n=1 Tax=Sphingomonas sp. TaxID=28214 RepID=UPI0035677BFD
MTNVTKVIAAINAPLRTAPARTVSRHNGGCARLAMLSKSQMFAVCPPESSRARGLASRLERWGEAVGTPGSKRYSKL